MTKTKKIKLFGTIFFLFALCCTVVICFSLKQSDSNPANRPTATSGETSEESDDDSTPWLSSVLVEGELQSGDTLSESLTRYNIEPAVRQQILENLASCLDFKRLQPKDKFRVLLDGQGQLLRCEYENGPLESYTITRIEDSFVTRKDQVTVAIKTCVAQGSISTSLFEAFFNHELQAPLVYAFADIFSSCLDFNTETQNGDTFQIVFEQYFKDDQFIGYGNILYAQYKQLDGQVHEGYFYRPDKNSTGAYFDAEGKGLGTSFIKSPVPLARVSSKFSLSRFHPISGLLRPHLGVDLAAPSGTPVMATSDGIITSLGYNGGFGRQIIISHAGGYQTFYGHLSRFSKGLKEGSPVKQKQIIGYIGSSGISTGPHLDYRVERSGQFYDPFSIHFAPRSVLRGEKLVRFKNQAVALASLLAETSAPEETLSVRYLVLKADEELTML